MRERITFFHYAGDAVDPAKLKVSKSAVKGPEHPRAAREDRLTLAVDELPDELRSLLAGAHELHVRWSAADEYSAVAPLYSRVSPGLHVSYTPRKDKASDGRKGKGDGPDAQQRSREERQGFAAAKGLSLDLGKAEDDLCYAIKSVFGAQVDCRSLEVGGLQACWPSRTRHQV